jgi:hypothetical protein
MKKVLLTILTLSYLIVCIGFTIQKPYCSNMNAKVSLSNCISKKCDKCNNENIKNQDNRCCNNESRFVKNENDQITPESVFHPAPVTITAIHTSFFELSFNAPASVLCTSLINHRQPPDGATAIYIRNCVFPI